MEQFTTSRSSSPQRNIISTAVLKRCIAACSKLYGDSFTGGLHSLAKTHRCVWLLAGLIQTEDGMVETRNNAKEICEDIFTIGG